MKVLFAALITMTALQAFAGVRPDAILVRFDKELMASGSPEGSTVWASGAQCQVWSMGMSSTVKKGSVMKMTKVFWETEFSYESTDGSYQLNCTLDKSPSLLPTSAQLSKIFKGQLKFVDAK